MKIPSPSRLAPTSHNSGKQASTFIIKIFTPPHKFEFDGPTIKIIKEKEKIAMASKAEAPELDDAVKAAREKLKARFGDKVRTGGKGKWAQVAFVSLVEYSNRHGAQKEENSAQDSDD